MQAPRNKKVARAVHANRGVESAYSKAIARCVGDLARSVEYWLTAAYRDAPPALAGVAGDASPAQRMRKAMRDLGARWIKRFDEWAPKLAELYVPRMYRASDSAFRQALRDAGWAVDFKVTPAMRDALNAQTAENIGLIKSIPERYLQQVEGVVMRSYTAGRDLDTMVRELKALYPAASNRAVLIARDQSNKANAVAQRARQMELGIKTAIWQHSHAGKTPRPDHLAADGKEYEIAKGCLISGEYIFPGHEINCRCTCRVVLPI